MDKKTAMNFLKKTWTLLLVLVAILALWLLPRYFIFSKYFSVLSEGGAPLGIQVESPSLFSCLKDPVRNKSTLTLPFGTKLYFLHETFLSLKGSTFQLETNTTPDESTGKYISIYFESPLVVNTKTVASFDGRVNVEGKLDPFPSRLHGMGPGMEVWAPNGLKGSANSQNGKTSAELKLEEFGVLALGVGVRVKSGRVLLEEMVNFEGTDGELYFINDEAVRVAVPFQSVKGKVLQENSKIEAEIIGKTGKKLTPSFSRLSNGEWGVDLNGASLPLMAGWKDLAKQVQ